MRQQKRKRVYKKTLQTHESIGVADGARTHDNRNHNPGLYQLSYSHRRSLYYSRATLISTLNFSFNSL